MTNILMIIILMFLGFMILYKAEYIPVGEVHLFDKKNSLAMRGFWSIIVILVHIPIGYSNRIQDMAGSFAYVGVTFFFMTSAYGLMLTLNNNPEGIKRFWRNRLPKLVIPMIFVNIVDIVFGFLMTTKLKHNFKHIFKINDWVEWLLVCYFFFLFINLVFKINSELKSALICCCILLFSVTIYCFRSKIEAVTWCPEIFGFIWGIAFFKFKEIFAAWTKIRWLFKCFSVCIITGAVGLSYLKFKSVVFWGDYVLKILLGFLILLFILVLNSHIKIGNSISLFLGKISYEIFLLHGTVFAIISFLFPEIESGIFVFVGIIVTIMLSYVVNLWGNAAFRGYALLTRK